MTPLPPIRSSRRKTSIEIYFVLYLSAIILLLGTTPSHRNTREDELEDLIRHLLVSDFKVKVEKAALLYSFIPAGVRLDTTGRILARDSVNTITARGTFSNVDFKILSIRDSGGAIVSLDRASLIRRDDRSCLFQWKPSAGDRNAIYSVTVAGIASPLPPPGLRSDLRDKVNEVLKRGGTVSDSVTFTVNVLAVNDLVALRRLPLSSSRPGDSGITTTIFDTLPFQGGRTAAGTNFELVASSLTIPQPPSSNWSNRITIQGATTSEDLDLQVSGGDAKVTRKGPSYIEVYGTTPMKGAQQITITGTPKNGGKPYSTSFTVKSTPLALPQLPQAFILGSAYRLDFRSSSEISNDRISVGVEENGKPVVLPSETGATLRYVPQEAGKAVITRYLGDQVADRYSINIVPIGLPTVYPPKRESTTSATITTIAYGNVRDLPNKVKLIVDEGNVEDAEQIDEKTDDVYKTTTQVWRITKKGSGEFRFTVHAVDLRGSRSGKSNQAEYRVQ
ncbi:MAG: hypothetical protein JWQ98_2748 [Chlorobi bacterium]|nr:hypothetical protein [Chlorobiota bacterium]